MPKIAQKMRKSLIKRMKKTKIITTLKNLHTRRGRWGNLFPSLLQLLLLLELIKSLTFQPRKIEIVGDRKNCQASEKMQEVK